MKINRALALTGVLAIVAGAQAIPFTVTVFNIGPQPLAPVFYASHNNTFDFFDQGAAASAAVERMAEEGDTSLLVALAGGHGGVMDSGTTTGPFMTGEFRQFVVNADATHPWLSFASMLGATNDAFIGSSFGLGDGQINLFQGGNPLNANFTVSFLDVWDAGTEVNTELMAHIPAFGNTMVGPAEGGVITQPHEGITGRGDLPQNLNWYGHDVARITIVPVPEPGSFVVLAVGIAGLLAMRRRR